EPGDKLISSRPLALRPDGEEQEVALSVTPDASGAFKYQVEAVPLANELSRANNRKGFDLEVMREKLRVLYICGQPGPEYAFLRYALRNDPLVELVSFVILRNPENIALVPENDLSLIPFPVHTIFTRDLYDFDLLVFENFSYRNFGFQPDYLKNIQRWVVEKGGGLAMIAGKNSFGSGGWNATPVGEILPAAGPAQADAFDAGPFRVKAADPGHPLMRLSDEASKNEAAWREMPELEGIQLLDPVPGAEVVATHPWTGRPVIAVWEKGKGRVLALASDTTWRWALQSSTPERYTRFWRNAVRYLARAGKEKKVNAQFDRCEYAAGQNFTLRLRENDRAPGRLARVTLTDPAGKKTELAALRKSDGTWDVTGSFTESGEYRFAVSLEKDGVRTFNDTVRVPVLPSLALEGSALDVNESFLGELARASGGEYFAAGSFSQERLAARVKRGGKEERSERKPLWDAPALLGLLAASLLAEWYMRRRKGMP
ncbi:MAG: glutamine amidotransferase, partial [Endomicrobiales bacterium]